MKQMKTIKFPGQDETYEIVDAQARAELEDLKENITIDETDPTVPAWAKEANKPSYTADEVGAAPAEHSHDYAPALTWGTEDIEAGSPSTEPTGTLHLVIE